MIDLFKAKNSHLKVFLIKNSCFKITRKSFRKIPVFLLSEIFSEMLQHSSLHHY